MIEQRRHARAPVNSPVTFTLKPGKSGAAGAGAREPRSGLAKDISIGGMFVETTTPGAFGAEVVIQVKLPGADDPVSLPGVVRWVRDGGMGVQFGLLGAKETHLITEINRKHSEQTR